MRSPGEGQLSVNALQALEVLDPNPYPPTGTLQTLEVLTYITAPSCHQHFADLQFVPRLSIAL